MKNLMIIMSLVAGMAIFNSCGPTRYTITEQPVAPVYERPVSPHPTYVWVDGEWHWHGSKYVYSNGHWSEPRGHHRVYVAGSWQRTNKGYYWKNGYWK